MKTLWRDKVIDVRACEVIPGHISEGDWVWLQGSYLRVTGIQRDCPRLENLNSLFTMFTCEREDGTLVPVRDLPTRCSVLKPNVRAVYLKGA